jgi:outer membrane protein OmpA-like peptidoglycan-associated protein
VKKITVVILLVIGLSLPLYAQDTGDVTNTGSNGGVVSSANDNKATATIVNEGGSGDINRQFAPAVPAGPAMYVIPGPGNSGMTGERQILPVVRFWGVKQFDTMAERQSNIVADNLLPWRLLSKNKRIFTTIYLKDVIEKNNDDVYFMDYDPREFSVKDKEGNPADKILAEVTVKGMPLWPESRFQAEGVKVCKERTFTRRVAMFEKVIVSSKTETSVKGVSLGGASLNGSNDVGLGSSLGYGKGSSMTFPEDWPEYKVFCMNDGPINGPPKKSAKITEAPKLAPEPEAKKEPQQKKEPQEVVVKIVVEQKLPQPQPVPTPQNLRASPSALSEVEKDVCAGMPKVTIYFNHAKSDIRDQKEMSKIEDFSKWKKERPGCRFQVRGNASVSGSFKLNNDLAMNRAISVTETLKKFGVSPEQFVSGGKYNTIEGSEYSQADRRVVFQAIGESSEK